MSDEARALVRELSDRLKASTTTLAHYSSQYYDPVKAHEYYEKTKQLKGGGSATASLTTKQREVSNVTNDQIKTAKDKDLDAAQTARDQRLSALKTKAEAVRSKIQKNLEERIAKLADQALKRIENLPEDADPALVQKLMQTHSKNANKARAQAHKEMASTAKSIRSAIASTRQNYSKSRTAITDKYAKAKTTEQTNIRANVR